MSDRNGVAVAGTVENRQVKEIYIADYDGANQRRVTVSRQLNLNPSWSPDARALAYTTYRPNPDMFVSLIYQGVLQNPTKGVGTNYLPVFSPDGKQIAFMSGRDGNPEIYAMNVDGSNVRRLTNHPLSDSTPTWSPSGSQIAFTSDRSGKAQIYVMSSADGSGVRRLTVNESEADRPTWSPPPFNEIAFAASTGPRLRHQGPRGGDRTDSTADVWRGLEREPRRTRLAGVTWPSRRRAPAVRRSSRSAATDGACDRLRARATTRRPRGRTRAKSQEDDNARDQIHHARDRGPCGAGRHDGCGKKKVATGPPQPPPVEEPAVVTPPPPPPQRVEDAAPVTSRGWRTTRS